MTDTQTALEAFEYLMNPPAVQDYTVDAKMSRCEEMVRAALQSRTEQEPVRHLPTRDEICSEIRGAIGEFVIGDGSAALAAEAVLALLHEKEPHEPLGWAYRFLGSPSGEWCEWKLVEKREDLVHDPRNFYGFQIEPLYTSPPDQSARIAELEAEKHELLEALEPFAKDGRSVGTAWRPDIARATLSVPLTITVGDMRAAAALHNKLKEK